VHTSIVGNASASIYYPIKLTQKWATC